MTETHAAFLPASGAVVIVMCAADNVLSGNARAFQQQLDFAQSIWSKIWESESIADIPVVLLLVSSDASRRTYAAAMQDFPALVTINDYTSAALTNAVRILFGQ
jgi:hypothetical protein